ncbi:hypothetical protein SCALIN_C04_0382 [Candidatus Scalindua japonica]|uniref:DUF3854 domain-containing protein n=1 Tax=Candidatus Scalindua japonica TaxID=1284222 RepID=A0A286TVM1_9BACT|nr:DUF3854 domain-containing protein [Candidatus Scalindua japonica]GAX59894.1 hypothetical protein SCALIN_C04_0382 [Candidatus Scalindua japonica]
MAIAPEHRKDLKRSGLSDDTIKEAGIKSVPSGQINMKLGFNIDGLVSMYEIPFDEDYSRFKACYEDGKTFNKDGSEKPKYLARKDSGNRLFIPSKAKTILQDVSIPLEITEGEKKSLKACQEGLYCIAITGLWNWKVKDKYELIPDYNEIALDGRTIYLIPDNDWLLPNRRGERKNLKQAVSGLAYILIDRGAKVYWRELPQGEGKIGLDDFLCHHSVDELKQLPVHQLRKLTLDEMISNATPDIQQEEIQEISRRIASLQSESEKSQYVNRLSDKTKISKRAITKDIKEQHSQKGSGEDKCKPALCANFPGLIDIVIDDTQEAGSALFMVKEDDNIHFRAEWELVSGEHYVPPSQHLLPFILPRSSKVKEWLQSDNDDLLFKDLIVYFKRFSYLPDEQWLIVACLTYLSYLQDHKDVHYLPMLLFFAVPERGKSRTGKSMAYVSYRGIHLVELREANLFRYSQNMKATLFFDMMNLWKKAEKSNTEDILLLRYEKGAKAARVLFPEKGAFEDTVHYDIFGSTILATNEPIHKILDTRCIPIIMPNRPRKYENPVSAMGQELKERLTAWRARTIDNPLPEMESVEGINGRLWDISKSMFQVCKLVHPEGLTTLKNALLAVAAQKKEDKKSGIDGQIVEAIDELSSDKKTLPEWEVAHSKLLELLNENRPETHKLTPQYLGRKLKAIGITTKIIQGYSEIQLKKLEFNTLLEQYGVTEPELPVETLPNSTTLSSSDISNTCTGRELVESQGNATKTLPTQGVEDKKVRRLVESGRELQGDGNCIDLENEEVEVVE